MSYQLSPFPRMLKPLLAQLNHYIQNQPRQALLK